MRRLALTLLLATLPAAHAQFDIEESHTTASLRGISNAGGGAVWASGTNGTVLRSEDGGYLWQTCTIPPGAEKLDFRGIQGFDENTAIVMSSGPGDQSRLYKTTDGCQTWKLLFTNPDQEGFWDAIQFSDLKHGVLLGDPVNGKFALFTTTDGGATWRHPQNTGIQPESGEALFAASNSSLALLPTDAGISKILFVTGSPTRPHAFKVAISYASSAPGCIKTDETFCASWERVWVQPIASTSSSTGLFSIALRDHSFANTVGGDYKQPGETRNTAAYSFDQGQHWQPAQTPPHGYRSAVAYDPTQKLWITVGPNGTDISTDDGRNWQPLGPGPTDPPDADKNWNALSLPFVAGPNGRIGRLRTITQTPPKKP